jgi:hypothetical protein
MEQQPVNPPAQAGVNLHQQKLYSLILGAVGLLGLILPWAKSAGFGGFGGVSVNGFQGWGILSLFGLVAILVSSLTGDKTMVYDQNMKYLAMGGFGALALGSFIYFMQISGNGTGALKSGIGVWLCIIPGVLGLLWVTGTIKLAPVNKSPGPTN